MKHDLPIQDSTPLPTTPYYENNSPRIVFHNFQGPTILGKNSSRFKELHMYKNGGGFVFWLPFCLFERQKTAFLGHFEKNMGTRREKNATKIGRAFWPKIKKF